MLLFTNPRARNVHITTSKKTEPLWVYLLLSATETELAAERWRELRELESGECVKARESGGES